jgi:nicotinamide N-methyltransferase
MSNMLKQQRVVDVYEQLWNPQDYLQQYYATSYVAEDEIAIFQHIISFLQNSNKFFPRAIDFGCGPTVHHAIPFVPYVAELHLADYLSSNLNEIQKWLNGDTNAHSWDMYIKGVLEIEGHKDIQVCDVEQRKQLMKEKITALKKGDLYHPHPLEDGSIYDLVTSFYCADAATSSKSEWRMFMKNLFNLVAPGGTIILSAVRSCRRYAAGEKYFPSANVNEKDLASVFSSSAFNFDPRSIEISVVSISEWVNEGFDSILIAKAQRAI